VEREARAVPTLLPSIRTHEEFARSPRDEATYRPAVEAICRRHGLPAEALRKYPGGSTIVFAVGTTHVVKLFEPLFAENAETEGAVLAHVSGRLSIPTPGVHAVGDMEGWRYVVMDQLRGDSLADAWSEVAPDDRPPLFRRLGEAIAGLHALAAPPTLPGPDWSTFVHGQAERCVERQRAHGLAEGWLRQIPAFLAAQDLAAVAAAEQVLLHTELMQEHVLVERGPEGWVPTGLFDFEPARAGAREYEFGAVSQFLGAGEPGLLRSFLLGYGYGEARLTPALQERMMLYTLLHRYSNLPWFMDRLPPKRATTLHELAAEWYDFGDAPASAKPS
jgi:hygromycin-B 7''-O-kinase